ncbi:hypothetical protein CAP36_13160 [Chitinophagaceae bacterium IBVUCB2]|nr:hypothetical protein CAP36_13160 [Chitinophagaceae bacterium IBVUCB2]
MAWKELLSDYFTFTRKERIGVVGIVLFIVSIFFLPKAFIRNTPAKASAADTSWIVAMKKLETTDTINNYQQTGQHLDDNNSNYYQYDRTKNKYYGEPQGELFYFDPNTISAEGWKKLGLREKTIGTILNYLNKGGKFRKPEDVQRIYGLFPNEYERIAPYIKIESTGDNKNYAENNTPTNTSPKTYTPRYAIVDVNIADTTAFIALPGIGSKLAARIINFRDKLGGFYSINQVGETFGLPDSTFQKIKQYLKLENGSVRKININTSTVDEMKTHPYIKYSLANPIIAYRNQHGSFTKVEDVKKVMAVTDEVYNKIAPYLIVQ